MQWFGALAAKQVSKVQLGPIKVSKLMMGTGTEANMREGNQLKLGKKKFSDLINFVYDQGIRFFDVADLYGTHEIVADALKSKKRDSFQVCSKVWVRPGHLPESERPLADETVERFLKELKLDYIDLVHIHAVNSKDWISKYDDHMNALAKLKKKGTIGAHGISCHSLEAMKTAVEENWVDVIHIRLNPYGVRMDAPPEEVVPLIAKAKMNEKGIVAMKLAGNGDFTKEQRAEAIRFALSIGFVDCLMMGMESEKDCLEFKEVVSESLKNRNPSH